jgi:hypothetical protein
MSQDKLSKATQYDIVVDEDGTILTSTKKLTYTYYGQTHGGQDGLMYRLLLAKAVAGLGSFGLVLLLQQLTSLDDISVAHAVIGFLLLTLVYDLVQIFRFVKLSRAAMVVAALVVCGVIFLALYWLLLSFLAAR